MNEFKEKIEILKTELTSLDIAGMPYQKAIEVKTDTLYKEKAAKAKEISMHQQAVRRLLTDEQRVYFDAQMGCRLEQGPLGPKGCQNSRNQ